MEQVSIMDIIMFDSQRQGRISFYMVILLPLIPCLSKTALTIAQVSAGEEGIAVGSASALEADDVVFCQYRETGVYKQRGFSSNDFMNQLFANKLEPGKGRNMPVHYGSAKLNIVSSPPLPKPTRPL